MDALNELLEQTTPNGLFLILLLLVACTKTFGDAVQWVYRNLKSFFSTGEKKAKVLSEHQEVMDRLDSLTTETAALRDALKKSEQLFLGISAQAEHMQDDITETRERESNIQSYLLNWTRATIIDKYHHYCYQTNAIDDLSLQNIEVMYLYYKAGGGNSFIDGLMEKIRELPRMNLENSVISEGER